MEIGSSNNNSNSQLEERGTRSNKVGAVCPRLSNGGPKEELGRGERRRAWGTWLQGQGCQGTRIQKRRRRISSGSWTVGRRR
jgi:hypothetical protein